MVGRRSPRCLGATLQCETSVLGHMRNKHKIEFNADLGIEVAMSSFQLQEMADGIIKACFSNVIFR